MRMKRASGSRRGRVLKPYPCGRRGDLQVCFSHHQKRITRLVSNLVAEAFVGPRPSGKEVNHKDLIFTHNCYRNLEYATPKGNSHHAQRNGHGFYTGEKNAAAKLTWDDVRLIRKLYVRGWLTQNQIAHSFFVTRPLIGKIVKNILWKEKDFMARKSNPAFMKELKCSEELREFTGEKKISRPALMKVFWKYAKKHHLQLEDEKRVVEVAGSKLEPLFSSKLIGKKREIKMRGKKIKIPAGCVFMTEVSGALSKHLS